MTKTKSLRNLLDGNGNNLIDMFTIKHISEKGKNPVEVYGNSSGNGFDILVNDEYICKDKINLTKKETQLVLLHEVGHVCCAVLKCKVGGNTEEKICDFFAVQMAVEFKICKDYKSAANYLAKGLSKLLPLCYRFNKEAAKRLEERIAILPINAEKAIKNGDPDLREPKNIIKFVA